MPDAKSAAGVPLVGDVIAGKYRIDSILGEGGMGIVYEAEHVILRQRVAIKALLPGATISTEVIERFSFEASTVASLANEHVVRVMDAGSLPGGSPYLVMEYLAGCDLNTLLARRGPLPETEVVDFALQALEGLAHAHAAGIVHRDLKPANLFLVRATGRQLIKLLDFGISKSLEMSTDDDRIVGSPAYMSPEQLEKHATIDFRTDIWSLGVVIYELLVGTPPFGGDFAELVAAILRNEPPKLHEQNPRVSPAVSAVVARCLQRNPAARWQSAAELARALVQHGSGAWSGAIARIEQVLSAVQPVQSTRRFESFENALQALESGWDLDGVSRLSSRAPDAVVIGRGGVQQPFKATWTEAHPPSAPADAELAVTCLPPESQPNKRNALRILLIDDSAIIRSLHQLILTEAGFDVRAAASPDEFEALLDGWKPHLVLMDIMMPAMNGDDLCRRVKARFKATVPVVLVSDLPYEELVARAKSADADGYVSKSKDQTAFVDYVRNICAITYSPEDLPDLP
jgi:eukaryotic-like serine/threonine-protein kinase